MVLVGWSLHVYQAQYALQIRRLSSWITFQSWAMKHSQLHGLPDVAGPNSGLGQDLSWGTSPLTRQLLPQPCLNMVTGSHWRKLRTQAMKALGAQLASPNPTVVIGQPSYGRPLLPPAHGHF